MRKLPKNAFITVEGIEGSGKTSQLVNIIKFFENLQSPVVKTREPGGTEIADQIRRILVEPHDEPLAPMAELLLYNAARVQHLSQVVRPALAAGKTVVCDRFTDATVAYQAYGRQLPLGTVNQINDWATDGLKPDLTLLLDCEPKKGIERSLARLRAEGSQEGRFEAEAIAFHERVRQGYLEIAEHQRDRVIVVDANRSAEELAQAIAGILRERLD